MAYHSTGLRAEKPILIIEENIKLNLRDNLFSKGLKIFSLLLPVIGYVSKWSNEYYFDIGLK
ncbi:MAG: hypothetical protein COC08_04940 [Maribacter sp.]|nr:MAG: hypothetical protein COC08_04940 [Maribacter sp.]